MKGKMVSTAGTILAISIFILQSILSQASIIAYDCSGSKVNKTTISLVDTPACTFVDEKPKIDQVGVVLTQTSDHEQVKVYRCLVKATHTIKRCGKFGGDDQVTGMYSQVVELGREACKLLVTNKIIRFPFAPEIMLEFESTGLHFRSFVSFGSDRGDGDCTPGGDLQVQNKIFERAVRFTSAEIMFSSVQAIVDFEEKLMIFPNGIKCDLTKGNCEHADYGSLFWDPVVPDCVNDVGNQAIIYNGPAQLVTSNSQNNSYLQLSHSGYDFQIKILPRSTFICGFRSSFTEHPRLFVTFLGEHHNIFPKLKPVDPLNINMMNYINSKLVYSMRHTKSEVDRLFKLFRQERCTTRSKIIDNMLNMAITSPIDFAYSYFKEPGYTAVVRGEVIHVAKCHPVVVTPLEVSDNICYNELRVLYKNVTMYMTPRSRILVRMGRRIDCASDIGALYKIRNRWVVQTSVGLIHSQQPEVVEVDPVDYSFDELKTLTSGGLYSQSIILNYQKTLLSPLEETIISSRVVSAITDGVEMPSHLDFSSAIGDKGLTSISDKIKTSVVSLIDPLLAAEKWFGVVLMITVGPCILLKVISYILNVKALKKFSSLISALLYGLFDGLVGRKTAKHLSKSPQVPSGFIIVPNTIAQDDLV